MKNRTLSLAGVGATAAAVSIAAFPAAAGATAHKAAAGKKYKATTKTMWGPVSVTITVARKKISQIAISADPHTPLSYQLQSYALPRLRTEALKKQTFRLHVVSGATFTSAGFILSLHSDMAHAHLK